MSHVWQGTHAHRRDGEHVADPGEEFEPTESELESFGDLIVPAEGDAGEESAEEDADDSWTFDAEEWLDVTYSEREQAVLDGEVDEYLDQIAECETSDTVTDAVAARRDELED